MRTRPRFLPEVAGTAFERFECLRFVLPTVAAPTLLVDGSWRLVVAVAFDLAAVRGVASVPARRTPPPLPSLLSRGVRFASLRLEKLHQQSQASRYDCRVLAAIKPVSRFSRPARGSYVVTTSRRAFVWSWLCSLNLVDPSRMGVALCPPVNARTFYLCLVSPLPPFFSSFLVRSPLPCQQMVARRLRRRTPHRRR